MINEAVKEELNEKIQEGEFDAADIPAYLTLFCEMGNEIEDLQDEVEDWNRRINLVLEGLGTYWITVGDGRFTTGEGAIENPNLVLTLDAQEGAMVFSGDKDAKAAYMSGALKVEGDLPDAVKMQTLIEIVVEEIEY
jgi:putative sterol carrier protein